MGYLDAQDGAHSRTAFRTAEKLYKRYKHSSTTQRISKSRKNVPVTDVSEVLDFRKFSAILKDRSCKINGMSLAINNSFDAPVFVLDGHPGFYFIPQALSTEEQFYWIQQSLTSFPQPPSRTNHNAVYGAISNLWSNAEEKRVLVEVAASESDGINNLQCCPELDPENVKLNTSLIKWLSLVEAQTTTSNHLSANDFETVQNLNHNVSAACPIKEIDEKVEEVAKGWQFIDASEVRSSPNVTMSAKPVLAKSLLRKLRWSTIGLQFDWSKKAYNRELLTKELPLELSELAARLAKPAMNGEKFLAEAAIVNYYGPDDMLGGHVDDMEADWNKPIVSISLGCKAIFLLGGTSRDDTPVAMFLRSGDVVLMAGPARRCFHGVPRIFVEPGDSDLPDFSAQEKGSKGSFLDYISQSRINVNIRQVN